MRVNLWLIGKTDKDFVKQGVEEYCKRLLHYLNFEIGIISGLKCRKNLSEKQQKQKEGELILAKLKPTDTPILLDEGGKAFSSVEFARFMEKQMTGRVKNLVFIVGGPYGFSEEVYKKAFAKISLSKMTFSHQMIRMIFVEQLYRAMTIIKGEAYHHI